eukprot:UN19097
MQPSESYEQTNKKYIIENRFQAFRQQLSEFFVCESLMWCIIRILQSYCRTSPCIILSSYFFTCSHNIKQ